MIVSFVPFAPDRNFGRACNEAMALLPDHGWGVILDHDAMFTTAQWYAQIAEAVRCQPRAMFFGMCNRIARPWQRIGDSTCHDVAVHRAFGAERLKQRTLLDITHSRPAGGVVMVVSKEAWREVGGFVDGMYCIDHRMHLGHAAVGRPVYVIEGLYAYHWRRGDGVPVVEEPKASCTCLTPRPEPTERIALP